MHSLLFLVAVLPLAVCRYTNLQKPRLQEVINSKPAMQLTPGNGGNIQRTLKPNLKIRSGPAEVLEVSASENLVLECEAGGNPPPTIHWLKDGKRIPQSVYEAIHPTGDEDGAIPPLGLSFTRSRLYVDCAGPKEAGVYTCVAENSFHRESQSTVLNVINFPEEDQNAICLAKKSFGSPARIHMWTHNRLELMGNDVQLFCRFDGEPQPKVTWRGPNDSSVMDNPEKYEVLENGDLVIRSIVWSDMGDYTCEVENSQGVDSTRTFLYPTQPDKRKISKA